MENPGGNFKSPFSLYVNIESSRIIQDTVGDKILKLAVDVEEEDC